MATGIGLRKRAVCEASHSATVYQRTGDEDFAAATAAFWSQVDDPDERF
ncbi:hypothetical protein ACNKHR_10305 [Shigella flexneri]